MTKMVYRVPSKTFLIGEYAVLQGGRALILCTEPKFELNADEFIDPFSGKGGFGASSAEFLLRYCKQQKLTGTPLSSIDLKNMLGHYHATCDHKKGHLPSGADVIAQYHGWVTELDLTAYKAQAHAWPFEDLSFLLVKLKQKTRTPIHLASLKPLQLNDFAPTIDRTIKAFHHVEIDPFISGINEYRQILENQNLVHPDTLALFKHLITPTTLAFKGCGALGTDVLLVMCEPDQELNLRDHFQFHGFQVVASQKDICGGLSHTLTGRRSDVVCTSTI